VNLIDLDCLLDTARRSMHIYENKSAFLRKKWKHVFWLLVFVRSLRPNVRLVSVQSPIRYIDDDDDGVSSIDSNESSMSSSSCSSDSGDESFRTTFTTFRTTKARQHRCKSTSRLKFSKKAAECSKRKLIFYSYNKPTAHRHHLSPTPRINPANTTVAEKCRKTQLIDFNSSNPKATTPLDICSRASTLLSNPQVLQHCSAESPSRFQYDNPIEVELDDDAESHEERSSSSSSQQNEENSFHHNLRRKKTKLRKLYANHEGSIFPNTNYFDSPVEGAHSPAIKTPRLKLYSIDLKSSATRRPSPLANVENDAPRRDEHSGSDEADQYDQHGLMLDQNYKNSNYYYIKKSELRSLVFSSEIYTPLLISNLNKQQLNMRKFSLVPAETETQQQFLTIPNSNSSIMINSLNSPLVFEHCSFNTIPCMDQVNMNVNDSANNLYELSSFYEMKVEAPSHTCFQSLLLVFKSIASTICVIFVPKYSAKAKFN
jgi:hypothetical protein